MYITSQTYCNAIRTRRNYAGPLLWQLKGAEGLPKVADEDASRLLEVSEWSILPLSKDTDHVTSLNGSPKCWYYAGPTSQTSCRHCINVCLMYLIDWTDEWNKTSVWPSRVSHFITDHVTCYIFCQIIHAIYKLCHFNDWRHPLCFSGLLLSPWYK